MKNLIIYLLTNNNMKNIEFMLEITEKNLNVIDKFSDDTFRF